MTEADARLAKSGAGGLIAPPVEDVELPHGFTLAQVNRLTVFAVRRQLWYQECDFDERVEIGWFAIVEHLYSVEEPPTISDVIKLAWRAIGRHINHERRQHGLNTNDRYAGVTAGFERYWTTSAHLTLGVDERVVEETALWQIWQQLRPLHKGVLSALALYDDHGRAAEVLDKPVKTFTVELTQARRAFLNLWHEHERPSRLWAHDRRRDPAKDNRHSVTNLIKRRERKMTTRAAAGEAPKGPGKGRKPADLGISVEELARRYQAGESIRQIAASLGLSYSVVQRRMCVEGIERRSGGSQPRNGRAANELGISVNELVKRYRQGESLRELSESLGVNTKLLQRRLRAAGVPMRRAGWPGRKSSQRGGVERRFR